MSRRSKRARPRWYDEGLSFKCTQCGNCCTIEGFVWVDRNRMETIAKSLGLSFGDFARRYVRKVGRQYSLIEKPDHACIFWEDGCTIYDVRPEQCRTWPFWPENLDSEVAWEMASEECPGIGGSQHYSLETVDELMRGRGETGSA